MPNHEGTYPPTRYLARTTHKNKSFLQWRPSYISLIRFFWCLAILHQESYTYKSAIRSCSYDNWTSPVLPIDNKLALIGDPQLVDENTYTRRGLALILTKFYTDLYMRRNWKLLHSILVPETIIFTGDLFDGGREWENDVWQVEFQRFGQIFPSFPESQIITSLPGNHDIGIADGIKKGVYDRFRRNFGDPNRILEIGDWEVVLLDTVTLSASDPDLSADARKFMDDFAARKSTKPTMLMTHVPLYREPDAPCGPLRESSSSIKIQKGYQYQNVLEPALSETVMSVIKPAVIFAGDDHDYCDYRHANGIHEYNVKSFSWAMGIQRPGIQLVSFSGTRYETHLCQLPNQLALLKNYGILLAISILSLTLVNFKMVRRPKTGQLPRTNKFDTSKYGTKRSTTLQVLRMSWLDLGKVAWPVLIFYVFMIWW